MNNFNHLLTSNDCLQLIEQKLHTNQFRLVEYSITPTSNQIDGYLAYHLRLKCLVLLLRENITKVVTFFLKKETKNTIDNELIEECLKSIVVERKELLFYQMLSEAKFLDQNETWAPKYYKFEKDSTLLILDDMGAQGFKVNNKNSYDLAHCKVLLKALTQMHAFSIQFEIKKSEELKKPFSFYEAYGEEMFKEVLYTRNNKFSECYLNSVVGALKHLIELLSTSSEETEKLCLAFDKKLDHVISDLMQPSKEFPNVVCHADLWSKNLMFKYDDENHTPVAACLIDFQTIRYGQMICDVLMFLYVNTTREFRILYLKELLEYYYSELDKNLKVFGVNLLKMYSKNDFYRSFRKYLPYGKIVGALHRITSSVDEDLLDEILNSKLQSFEFLLISRAKHLSPLLENNVNGYRDKCKEIIDELKQYLIGTNSNDAPESFVEIKNDV